METNVPVAELFSIRFSEDLFAGARKSKFTISVISVRLDRVSDFDHPAVSPNQGSTHGVRRKAGHERGNAVHAFGEQPNSVLQRQPPLLTFLPAVRSEAVEE